VSYSEQIRHPSGALDPPENVKRRGLSRLSWILLGLCALALIVWRAGWFDKVAATGASAVTPIPNPHEWV
jgi:hypothetical protein